MTIAGTPSLHRTPRVLPRPQGVVVGCAAVALAAIALLAALYGVSWRVPLLALVGGGLGFVLFQATFGFAGSFRAALERGDFSGFRAQAMALALTSLVFFPLLAQGSAFGLPLNGFVTPIGISFVIGAVLFGIGMQIGGGCASGTLFALGGGNARLVMTLAFFILGSVVGAAHLGFWWRLPVWQSGATQDWLGWPAALALHLAIFVAIIRAIPAPPAAPRPTWRGLILQPWPLAWGAFGTFRSHWSFILVGHVLFTLPFMVRATLAVMLAVDLPTLEEGARSLGAGFLARFRTIVLPNAAPGILAGALMVVTLSLGEFNMTLLLHTPFTMTLPVGLADAYASMRLEIGSAYTLIFLVLLIPLLVALQWAVDATSGVRRR